MTTQTATRVFMVGKSDAVMAEMARDMGPEFAVHHSQDVARACADFDPERYDVAILGRALKAPDRDRLLRTIAESEHPIPVITSLAPCGRLSAAHARAAVSAAATGERVLEQQQVTGRGVTFRLRGPAEVTMTLYTLTMMRYILKEKPLFDGLLGAGVHHLPIRRSWSDRFERKHLYLATADGRDAFLTHLPGL